MQLYPVSRLSSDISIALARNISLLHLSSPPFSFSTFSSSFPDLPLIDSPSADIFSYDMRSVHSSLFDLSVPYLVELDESFSSVSSYLNSFD